MRYLAVDFDVVHYGGPGKSAPTTSIKCRHCWAVRAFQGNMPEHWRLVKAMRATEHTENCALLKAASRSVRKL